MRQSWLESIPEDFRAKPSARALENLSREDTGHRRSALLASVEPACKLQKWFDGPEHDRHLTASQRREVERREEVARKQSERRAATLAMKERERDPKDRRRLLKKSA